MHILLQLHPQAITAEFLQQQVHPQLEKLGFTHEKLPLQLTPDTQPPKGDFVVALGGDGTFLAGARAAAQLGIPVIGLEMGRLGFLCQLPVDRLPEVLRLIKHGDYSIERRRVLACDYSLREAGSHQGAIAVNDVVMGKGELTRLVSISVLVDGEHLGTFKADGVIVASATGSTAYSLSVGGPLVEPELALILISPIAAHTLYTKPFVISGEREVELRPEQEEPRVELSLDGLIVGRVREKDEVRVRLREEPLQVARLPAPSFFRMLRDKLGWGFAFREE